MYYEINVALNGKHYFATSERSITTSEKAHDIWAEMNSKFPASEGYDLSIVRYETVGTTLKWK
jgi:hypothetical protein